MRDILVIGGGVIGLLTARELSRAGATVTLVEMGESGRQSAWAGGGILSPLYPWRVPESVTALAHWSQRIYPELVSALQDATGLDPEFTTNGLLVLDDDDLNRARTWAAVHNQQLTVLDAATVRTVEPELGPHPAHAVLLPDVAQLRPPRFAQAVRSALDKQLDLREREEVCELLVEAGHVRGVRTPNGVITAERIVICAGAWTAKLLEQLGTAPDIQPVRGQMLLFHAKPGQIQHITLHGDRYVIPRRDGRVLFGSTLEHIASDTRTLADEKEALYDAAVELFPVLRRTPIADHWAGVRPGSPSGIPYIGAYPSIDGLYFNAGHFRNGLVLGPASARLMTDLILGREPILDPTPYALDAQR